jgi:hypothetical protein
MPLVFGLLRRSLISNGVACNISDKVSRFDEGYRPLLKSCAYTSYANVGRRHGDIEAKELDKLLRHTSGKLRAEMSL